LCVQNLALGGPPSLHPNPTHGVREMRQLDSFGAGDQSGETHGHESASWAAL